MRSNVQKSTRCLDAFDIDYDVNELRKATRILSCCTAYHLEFPKGSKLERSDYNQYVQTFELDPVTLMAAVERVAEMVEDLYLKVCDPNRPATT